MQTEQSEHHVLACGTPLERGKFIALSVHMKKETGLESVSCVDKTIKLSTQVPASENKDAKRGQ